jgi:hypothetical protein
MSYKLIVDGVELDTYGDLGISLNYKLADIFDVSSRSSNFSRTILLPGTPTNNIFFKHIKDVNVTGVNVKKASIASIQAGSNELLKGNLFLIKIIDLNDKIEYEVQINGLLSNILLSMNDVGLNALNMSEFNHIRSRDNIINSWDFIIHKNGIQTDIGAPGYGYMYPYIIYGNFNNVFYNSYISDLFPAFYVKTIIDKIFEFTGYTYTSKFFNTILFNKLIMPFTGDKLQKSEETMIEQTTRVGVNNILDYFELFPPRTNQSDWWKNYVDGYYTLPLDRESGEVDDITGVLTFQDPLSSWDGGKYICQQTGYYNIILDGKLIARYSHVDGDDIEYDGGSFNYLYHISKNGNLIYQSDPFPQQHLPSDTIPHPSPWYDIDAPLNFSATISNILLEVGDVIRVGYGFQYTSMQWAGDNDKVKINLNLKKSLGEDFTKFIVEPADNAEMGNTDVNMNQILPADIKMKDFFLSICNMFNLIIVDNPDKQNDLIIEPYDEYFKSKQLVVNWDEDSDGTGGKIDENSEITIEPMSELDFKTYLYTYQADDDLLNKEYTNETKRIYGDLKLDIDSDYSQNVDKTELIFAATPVMDKFTHDRLAGYFVEQDTTNDFKPKKVKPRILLYGTKHPTIGLRILDYDTGPETIVYEYPFCSMWDDRFNPKYSLEFSYPGKLYFDTTVVPTNNLYNKFHRGRMSQITDIDARLLTGYFRLTNKDIAEFDFRNIIFLMDNYWRVNSIDDFNPANGESLTKVTLIKINELAIFDLNSVEIPTSNKWCPPDIVAKAPKPDDKFGSYYFSLSGQIITDDCCKQLGGYMDGGRCRPRVFNKPQLPGETSAAGSNLFDPTPTTETGGPIVFKKNGNTIDSPNVNAQGKNNYGDGLMIIVMDQAHLIH